MSELSKVYKELMDANRISHGDAKRLLDQLMRSDVFSSWHRHTSALEAFYEYRESLTW